MSSNIDYNEIQAKLRLLQESAKALNVFGAESHQYQSFPPLAEGFVQQFELQHRITLPADYRGFLIQVGNGGAGPSYGFFKLGEMDDGFGFKTWQENDGFVGILSRPFPHTERWNDLSR